MRYAPDSGSTHIVPSKRHPHPIFEDLTQPCSGSLEADREGAANPFSGTARLNIAHGLKERHGLPPLTWMGAVPERIRFLAPKLGRSSTESRVFSFFLGRLSQKNRRPRRARQRRPSLPFIYTIQLQPNNHTIDRKSAKIKTMSNVNFILYPDFTIHSFTKTGFAKNRGYTG